MILRLRRHEMDLGLGTMLALGFSSPMYGGPWHGAAAFLAYCVLFLTAARPRWTADRSST